MATTKSRPMKSKSASEKRQASSEARQAASEKRQTKRELRPQVLVHEDDLQRVVREAIHNEFAALGLVADGAAEASELQKDFAYLRTWRTLVQKGGVKIMITAVGLIVTGMIAATLLALGIPAKFLGLLTGSFGS